MQKIIYETGVIVEFGQGVAIKNFRQFSHIVLRREDGTNVTLENVGADGFLIPTLTSIGAHVTIAFINRNMRLPKELGSLDIRNVIIAGATSDGYMLGPKDENPALKRALGIFTALMALLALYGFVSGKTGFMVIGLFVGAVTGVTVLGTLSGERTNRTVREQLITQFEKLGFKPKASKVYA